MPDETNDQVGKEETLNGASDQQKDGDVSSVADANAKPSAEAAAPPEEEPVGSNRSEHRPIRKMSAADFRVRSGPKPEPQPATQEPIQPVTPPQETQPAPVQEPVQPVIPPQETVQEPVEPITPPQETQPAPAQQSSGIPSSRPAEPIQERKPIEEKPAAEPPTTAQASEPEQVYHEPIYEQPKYEYNEPAEEPKYNNKEPPRSEPKKDRGSGGVMDALKAALSFFTILPLKVEGREINAMTNNMYVVPIVGFVIGIIATIMGLIFAKAEAGAMAGIAVLATTYIISKFLHFDGLADFGDGMICSGDREKSISALKDTKIGAGGLGIALIVIFAIFAGISGILGYGVSTTSGLIEGFFLFGMAIVIMEVFAKNAMVAAAAFGEPGNGMASEQVRSSSIQTLLMSTLISVCLAFVGYLLMGLLTGGVLQGGIVEIWDTRILVTAVLMIVGGAIASFVVGWLLAYLSNKKFGFVNGDVLGASNEISKVMFLFIALIVLGLYTS